MRIAYAVLACLSLLIAHGAPSLAQSEPTSAPTAAVEVPEALLSGLEPVPVSGGVDALLSCPVDAAPGLVWDCFWRRAWDVDLVGFDETARRAIALESFPGGPADPMGMTLLEVDLASGAVVARRALFDAEVSCAGVEPYADFVSCGGAVIATAVAELRDLFSTRYGRAASLITAQAEEDCGIQGYVPLVELGPPLTGYRIYAASQAPTSQTITVTLLDPSQVAVTQLLEVAIEQHFDEDREEVVSTDCLSLVNVGLSAAQDLVLVYYVTDGTHDDYPPRQYLVVPLAGVVMTP